LLPKAFLRKGSILVVIGEGVFMPKIKKGTKISDLAGSWKMSDEEAAKMEAAIENSWKKWRISE
jgi:hypothetical protein